MSGNELKFFQDIGDQQRLMQYITAVAITLNRLDLLYSIEAECLCLCLCLCLCKEITNHYGNEKKKEYI